MSGSGSRDPRPEPKSPKKGAGGGGGGGTSADPCDISVVSVLNSPNATVVATLRQGDVLTIEYSAGPPAQLLAKQAANIAGSITAASMMQIIQCITQQGVQYVGDVLSVKGAMCQVRVRRA